MNIFLKATWEKIIMANYPIDGNILLPYLPNGVELDLFDGKAWVSLVGFLFKNTKLWGFPIPYFGTFEEINLRFYVKRKVGDEIRRGVVFINETVPYPLVAWVANLLYKEHYTAIKTGHLWNWSNNRQTIRYEWKSKKNNYDLTVQAGVKKNPLEPGSFEEFIFEHYYGYTKISKFKSEEYRILHPSWETYPIYDFEINCDFKNMYGEDFKSLNRLDPQNIFIAEGSSIAVEWERKRF